MKEPKLDPEDLLEAIDHLLNMLRPHLSKEELNATCEKVETMINAFSHEEPKMVMQMVFGFASGFKVCFEEFMKEVKENLGPIFVPNNNKMVH